MIRVAVGKVSPFPPKRTRVNTRKILYIYLSAGSKIMLMSF